MPRDNTKCYVIDQELGSTLTYKLGQNNGRLMETTVALELLKQDNEIGYQQNGSECDLVVTEKGNITEANQVSVDLSENRTREREVRGLVKTCQIFALNEGTILTLDQTEELERDGVRVRILPAWQYFYSA